jgi:hypothetical protein
MCLWQLSSPPRPLLLYTARLHSHILLSSGGTCLTLPWVVTRTWGLSVIYFPREKYQQQWDKICFNDGGSIFSAGSHRGLEEHVQGKCCAPHRPTSHVNRVGCQHIFEQLGKRRASFPSSFYSISVSNSGFFLSYIMSQHDGCFPKSRL